MRSCTCRIGRQTARIAEQGDLGMQGQMPVGQPMLHSPVMVYNPVSPLSAQAVHVLCHGSKSPLRLCRWSPHPPQGCHTRRLPTSLQPNPQSRMQGPGPPAGPPLALAVAERCGTCCTAPLVPAHTLMPNGQAASAQIMGPCLACRSAVPGGTAMPMMMATTGASEQA